MPCSHSSSLGRRAFVAGGGGLLIGCTREASPPRRAVPTASTSLEASDAGARAAGDAAAHALFDAYPALAKTLPRVPLGRFPSAIERAASLAPGSTLYIKRDDDFARAGAGASADVDHLSRLFGGEKVRKLELYFGEARALEKRRILSFGGVGSNQALAVAVLGRALGFSVRLHPAPQPISSLTTKNLGADTAAGAELGLFDTVHEGHARAQRDARESDELHRARARRKRSRARTRDARSAGCLPRSSAFARRAAAASPPRRCARSTTRPSLSSAPTTPKAGTSTRCTRGKRSRRSSTTCTPIPLDAAQAPSSSGTP